MKKIFLLILMATALFSCQKESNETDNIIKGRFALALKIVQSGGTHSRSLQDPGSTETATIKSMIIEIFDATKKQIGEAKELTADEIKATLASSDTQLGDKGRIIIDDVDKNASFLRIWAFQKEGVTAETLPVINKTVDINTLQMEFAEIPYFPIEGTVGNSKTDANGFISINKEVDVAPGPSTETDKKVCTVEATIAPKLARFEILPTPNTGGVKLNFGSGEGQYPSGAEIAVTGIYMNNISSTMNAENLTEIKSNNLPWNKGGWAAGHPYIKYPSDSAGKWSNMFTIGGTTEDEQNNTTANTPITFNAKPDSYNLFGQKVGTAPHMVIRVIVDLTNVTDADAKLELQQLYCAKKADASGETTNDYELKYYGYVTVKDFTISMDEGSTSSGKLSSKGIVIGKIYRVALDLTLKHTNIDPDPEAKLADLYTKVEIKEWKATILAPDLE